ncbi:MAG: phosphoenolpyruvate carboxykinase (ATP) [Porticoccaceae bacterium]
MTQQDDYPTRRFTDLQPAELVEQAILRREGILAGNGALVTFTGQRTDHSPDDRFIVDEPSTTDTIDWGPTNRPFAPDRFTALWDKVQAHLRQGDRFSTHLHVGQDPEHYIPVKVTSQTAWHALFARNIFITPTRYNPSAKEQWKILHAADFVCDPLEDGTHSDAAVIINFARRKVLIAGLRYAGEIKTAMFAVHNFLLPEKDVLPMHCAANVGADGDVALFFGLSGSGKTTLSATPDRPLIGDDEHAWSRGAVFNLEGGCYAKTIGLTRDDEPLIWDAVRFGAIVENVTLGQGRQIDYRDSQLTANGRCSFPLSHLASRHPENRAGEPRHILFLSCDVSGVLPPVAVLDRGAAAYHFLSGYSARVGAAGSAAETAIAPEFAACFGASFMSLSPAVYAELLLKRIEESGSRVYLVNTGWSGGPQGEGARFPLSVTRAIVAAITRGDLEDAVTERLPVLNLQIPLQVPGVDSRYLNPRNSWGDAAAYDAAAAVLARLFMANIARFDVSRQIAESGPQCPPLATG